MATKGLPGRYAKFLTAVAGIGIVYAQNQFGASNQWVQAAVAAAAALGVLAVPNTPAPSAVPVVTVREVLAGPISKGGYEATLKAAAATSAPAPPAVPSAPPPVT